MSAAVMVERGRAISGVPPPVIAQVSQMILSATLTAHLPVPARFGWDHWTRFADGLSVKPVGLLDTWVVLPGRRDDRPFAVCCGTCKRFMLTGHDAMEVADSAYPPNERSRF